MEIRNEKYTSVIEFCRWDLIRFIFTEEIWFHLSRYIDALNNRYWNSIILRQNSEVAFHDLKTGVLCIIVAIQIVDPHILNRLLIQGGMSMIFFDFLESIMKDDEIYGYFMQDGGTIHALLL